MRRHISIVLFCTVTIFLCCGLILLWISGSPYASGPFYGAVILIAVVIATYALLWRSIEYQPQPDRVSDQMRRRIWWTLFALMLVSSLATFVYIPTTALSELIKRALIPGYAPQLDANEIRLSAAFMPIWCQALLEFARRVAAPYCLVEFLFGNIFVKHRFEIAAGLFGMLALFTLTTLDRVIGVLYLASALVALILVHGLFGALRNKYTYICIVGIFAVIIGFKQLQYGDFAPISFSTNNEIRRELSAGIQRPATPVEPGLPMSKTAKSRAPGGTPSPTPEASARLPEASASPPVASAATPSTATPEAQQGPTKSSFLSCSDTEDGHRLALCYISYSMLSVLERIVLSPVAMIVYASETYNNTNFLHWKKTRLFSLLGFGKYVDPLEVGEHKHHDAFPVTLIGDLWRNGGVLYFPFYAAILGMVLFLMDRKIFSSRLSIAPAVLAIFGIMFLFYGNAFNSTSWMLIASSLALATLMPKIGMG